MPFLTYRDADGGIHPGICEFPYIVLRAKNSNDIRKLRAKVMEAGLPFTDFVSEMIGRSAADQMEQTSSTKEADLDYIGLTVFGEEERLRPLISRFSLYTTPVPTTTPLVDGDPNWADYQRLGM